MTVTGEPIVAVVGKYQDGKSSLINALLGGRYAQTGSGNRTTGCCAYYRYGEKFSASLAEPSGGHRPVSQEAVRNGSFQCGTGGYLEVSCPAPLLRRVVLVDTPGIGVSDADDETARDAIRQSAFVIFLHGSGKGQLDTEGMELLDFIRKAGKRILFLFNCKDDGLAPKKWRPNSKASEEICKSVAASLEGMGKTLIPVKGRIVWPCNPVFSWYAQGLLEQECRSCADSGLREQAEGFLERIRMVAKNRCRDGQDPHEALGSLSGMEEICKAVESAFAMELVDIPRAMQEEAERLAEGWKSRCRRALDSARESMIKAGSQV